MELSRKRNVPQMQKINGSLNRSLLKADLIRGNFNKKKVTTKTKLKYVS